MKRQIFLAFFLISITVSAQYKFGEINLDFGKKTQKESGNIIAIAGEMNDSIYALSRTKKEFFIQTFDAKTKRLISSKPIIIERNQEIRDFVILGEKLYLMISHFDDELNIYRFLAKEIDENNQVNTTAILSVRVKGLARKGEFFFNTSKDGSQYLVSHVFRNNRNRTIEYSLTLIDDNLNKVFYDTSAIASKKRRTFRFRFTDIQLNENGDIIFSIMESYKKKHEKSWLNYITLYAYQANNDFQKSHIEIMVEGWISTYVTIVPAQNNTLHMFGFYSKLIPNERPRMGFGGIYDVVVDLNTRKVINKSFNPIPLEIKEQLIGRRKAKKGRGLSYDRYKNRMFIERDNGGIFVLSEYYWRSETDTFLWPAYSLYTKHVVVFALNPDGTLQWTNFIPKIQRGYLNTSGMVFVPNSNYAPLFAETFPLATKGTGEEYLSVFPIYANSKLMVLCNDHYWNRGKTNVRGLFQVFSFKDMMTTAYIFDEETGERRRIDPEDFQRGQIILKPLINKKLSNNRYLIYGGNKEENALGELVIKD